MVPPLRWENPSGSKGRAATSPRWSVELRVAHLDAVECESRAAAAGRRVDHDADPGGSRRPLVGDGVELHPVDIKRRRVGVSHHAQLVHGPNTLLDACKGTVVDERS